MKYQCPTCKKHFNVGTGSYLQGTHVSLRKWVYAIYLALASLTGISSMKLHRELEVTQKTAWYMLHRIREAMNAVKGSQVFEGEVEIDETFIGGRESNTHQAKRLKAGRGTVGKKAVVGIKDRESGQVQAEVVPETSKVIIEDFIRENVETGSTLYTDDAQAYNGIEDYEHEPVKHSFVGKYVRDKVHTNSIESFWAPLKRGYYVGTYLWMSFVHLHRYVAEFSSRNNIRDSITKDQMKAIPHNMSGTRLSYKKWVGE